MLLGLDTQMPLSTWLKEQAGTQSGPETHEQTAPLRLHLGPSCLRVPRHHAGPVDPHFEVNLPKVFGPHRA